MNRKIKLALMGTAAGLLGALDNSIKNKVESGRINNGVIDKRGVFEIRKHHNKGIPLNMLDKHTKGVTVASAVMAGVSAVNMGHQALNSDDGMMDLANTLILGGALSNTYDRVARGYVVDYLMLGRKRAIYNISDFMIFGGIILSLAASLKVHTDLLKE